MIIYRCDECGEDISERLRITTRVRTGREAQFCTIGCLTDWAAEAGYRDDDDTGWADA